MGRIQASIGLITGVPITDTVDKLIALSARSRDAVAARNKILESQQVAVTELTALVVGLEFTANNLLGKSLYQARSITSSAPNLLSATVKSGASPALGTYQFTPVRQAQSHQVLSSGFSGNDTPIGAGTLAMRFGGFVDEGIGLDRLNEGKGVRRGEIRITDRSGAAATIDLRFARTIDDVLTAINNHSDIDVTATVANDRIVLTDNTGQTTANLRVQEVAGGSTAADLGLAGINVAAESAAGADVFKMYGGMQLSQLNAGNGVSFQIGLPDLEVTFRDGSDSLLVDFQSIGSIERKAAAWLQAENGADARLKFTAVHKGAEYDGVTIRFVADPDIDQGGETVAYDGSDPLHRTLTFTIAEGETTANDIIAALENNAQVAALFTAETHGGDGSGLISTADETVTHGGAAHVAKTEKTVGDLLATLNAADPQRLRAELSSDGDRIVLIDLTDDLGGEFSVKSYLTGTTAHDLGLTGEADNGVITGGKLLGGLKTTLLRNLNGGRGWEELGAIEITDRAGNTAQVDLSTAETLDDVIAAINNAGLGVKASINSARNGIALEDTTGAALANFSIQNADATETATKLGIVHNAAATQVNSGMMNKQVVSEYTKLDDYNGGMGVARQTFIITDSSGQAASVRLGAAGMDTIGDLIREINNLTIGVRAEINAAGDGIAIINTASGGGKLTIRDNNGGFAAQSLGIRGESKATVIDGVTREVIDGRTTKFIEIGAEDTLDDVIQKINDLDYLVSASKFVDGSGANPYRLSLLSLVEGKAGELMLDTSGANFNFNALTAAQDALLLYGSSNNAATGVLVSSSRNVFEDVIEGVTLTVLGSSSDSVNVHVAGNVTPLVNQMNLFVEQYNKMADKLKDTTFYNEIDKKMGVLFGSNEALRLQADFGQLLTGRFFGVGSIQSLETLGLSLNDQGKLSFDEVKLRNQYSANREDLEKFFTEETNGFATKLKKLSEVFAGRDRSLLVTRVQTLQQKMENNQQRIDFMTERLERERERLLLQFYNMELAIGKIQNNLTVIDQLKPIPPLGSTRS